MEDRINITGEEEQEKEEVIQKGDKQQFSWAIFPIKPLGKTSVNTARTTEFVRSQELMSSKDQTANLKDVGNLFPRFDNNQSKNNRI